MESKLIAIKNQILEIYKSEIIAACSRIIEQAISLMQQLHTINQSKVETDSASPHKNYLNRELQLVHIEVVLPLTHIDISSISVVYLIRCI
jgi:hypothetical protein